MSIHETNFKQSHVFQIWFSKKGHDAQCLTRLKIISVDPKGILRARLMVDSTNLNRLSSVHGGLLATIVDSCGSLSLSARGLWVTGVSTDIHVSFLRSAGTTNSIIDIEAKVDSIGKTLAYTSVIIRNPETGKILARGSHTKFVATALEHEKNVKFDETGDKVIKGTMPTETKS